MGNFVIVRSDYRLLATVNTSSGWTASRPASSLLDYRPSYTAAISGSSAHVVFDLGEDKDLQTFGLVHHNGTSADTFRIRADSTLSNLTPTPSTTELDSGTLTMVTSQDGGAYVSTANDWSRKSVYYEHPDEVSARYVRLDIVNNPGTFTDAGVFVMDSLLQPSRNMQLRHNPPAFKQRAESRIAHDGSVYIVRNAKRRESSFTLILEDYDEFYDGFWELERTHGTADPFLFVYDPDSDDTVRGIMWCTLSRSSQFTIPNYNLNEMRITVREVT